MSTIDQPLTEADRGYLHGHAHDYAQPAIDPDRATAYADWYLAQYASRANDTMAGMPAHTSAWPKFLASYNDAETGYPARQDSDRPE